MTLVLQLDLYHYRSCHWKLNDFLLKLSEMCARLVLTIDRYILDNSSTDASVLCGAHKPVIRSKCIAEPTCLKNRKVAVRL